LLAQLHDMVTVLAKAKGEGRGGVSTPDADDFEILTIGNK
jgi:hypothetical protein